MKKILIAVLMLALLLCFAACGEKKVVEEGPVFDPSQKAEGVMSYAQYVQANDRDAVVVEAYVQACQSWWDNKIAVYAQDPDGGYFFYNMACSEEDAEKLVPGTKIRVEGTKTEWLGEVKIADGIFTIEEGSWIAEAEDVTSLLGTEALAAHLNKFVAFKDLTVAQAAAYKYDNSGMRGDDLYFKVSSGGKTYTFMVESYLCGKKTEVYKAVEALKPGDKINAEGFLFWEEEPNPNITKLEQIVEQTKN